MYSIPRRTTSAGNRSRGSAMALALSWSSCGKLHLRLNTWHFALCINVVEATMPPRRTRAKRALLKKKSPGLPGRPGDFAKETGSFM